MKATAISLVGSVEQILVGLQGDLDEQESASSRRLQDWSQVDDLKTAIRLDRICLGLGSG
jgi:hypothetical protein